MERVGLYDLRRPAIQISPGFLPSQVHSRFSNLYDVRAQNFYSCKKTMTMHREGHYVVIDIA